MGDARATWPRWPQIDARTLEAVSASLVALRWSISGPASPHGSFIARAEADFARLVGRRYCVTTCNGSSAIVIALQALGIGPGHRVLMPATTWVGCATAVHRVGATPVLVDGDDGSPCIALDDAHGIDPESIDAILAVHLYASHERIDRLKRWAPHAKVVEDCSHCHGAVNVDGMALGTLGDISIFSFQATKTLTCGEGGAAVTDDPAIAARLSALRADSRRALRGNYSETDLEPARLVHGANHALSEIHAAILCDQMERLASQNSRRVDGAGALVDALRDTPLRVVGSSAAFRRGAFYGVIITGLTTVWGPEATPLDIIEEVERTTGARCREVYPPVPAGPLYLPATNSLYRMAGFVAGQYPNAERWCREAVVVPHQLLLGGEKAIAHLAGVLAGASDGVPIRVGVSCRPEAKSLPEVTVVILTRDRPERLADALRAVADQDYEGTLRVVIFGDNAPYVGEVSELFATTLPLKRLTIDGWCGPTVESPFKRIPILRNMALQLVDTPLVCFLDDDNVWAFNHVSSLVFSMRSAGVPAVHSWRRLVRNDGSDCIPDDFPWLPAGEASRRLYEAYLSAGVLSHDDAIVRDVASLIVDGRELGMVDMGEWLFERQLLKVVGFETTYSDADVAGRITEDDKLLARLRSLEIPIACTAKPTLVYRLGGFSNAAAEPSIDDR